MDISATAERVRLSIYRELAATGRVTRVGDMATQYRVPDDEVATALDELATARHVVMRDGEIEMAHPFATRSFGFSVMGARTLWWGGCAWDAFAIPHLVPDAPEVLVATTCPACGRPHAWVVTNAAPPEGEEVAHFLVPAHEIWPDAAHACENQLLFCSEQCVTTWLNSTGNTRGYVMSLATLWQLARGWYAGRLHSPYQRRDPASAADYFREVGLRGSFWGLDD